MGWRLVQGICLLLMFVSASVSMLAWAYFDSSTAGAFGSALGVFLMGAIGLLFAFVFERSRTPRATARYLATRLPVVLVLAAGAAYLVEALWLAPERDELDANLEGATCGKYTGTVVKGWEQICAEQREREAR
ncbi:hypothetical protein [Pseudomonas sp. RGB]|uniref:hypothetical protein n=1 Tax=Pseudomonas sp. RGB TaxID=2598474 RepID=UPI0011933002|nr:hypothetical protein [Pseudomonas sp. RGB]TVT91566.1 hypothetical protein FPT15_07325 [Pseudomonas sp. RGB]